MKRPVLAAQTSRADTSIISDALNLQESLPSSYIIHITDVWSPLARTSRLACSLTSIMRRPVSESTDTVDVSAVSLSGESTLGVEGSASPGRFRGAEAVYERFEWVRSRSEVARQ